MWAGLELLFIRTQWKQTRTHIHIHFFSRFSAALELTYHVSQSTPDVSSGVLLDTGSCLGKGTHGKCRHERKKPGGSWFNVRICSQLNVRTFDWHQIWDIMRPLILVIQVNSISYTAFSLSGVFKLRYHEIRSLLKTVSLNLVCER